MTDIHTIPPEHAAIDAELDNWGRWSRASRAGSKSAPMWARYIPPAKARLQYGAPTHLASPDETRALAVEHAIRVIQPSRAGVLRWFYVFGGPPFAVARRLQMPVATLAGLLYAGRAEIAQEMAR